MVIIRYIFFKCIKSDLKKILLFIHNSSVALQMVTYLKKYNLKKNNHKITIFIEGNLNNLELRKDIKFIFKHLNFKIINLKIKILIYLH